MSAFPIFRSSDRSSSLYEGYLGLTGCTILLTTVCFLGSSEQITAWFAAHSYFYLVQIFCYTLGCVHLGHIIWVYQIFWRGFDCYGRMPARRLWGRGVRKSVTVRHGRCCHRRQHHQSDFDTRRSNLCRGLNFEKAWGSNVTVILRSSYTSSCRYNE